jgi:hypothetical protein
MQKILRRFEVGKTVKAVGADFVPLDPREVRKAELGPIEMLKHYLARPSAVGDREMLIFLTERAFK